MPSAPARPDGTEPSGLSAGGRELCHGLMGPERGIEAAVREIRAQALREAAVIIRARARPVLEIHQSRGLRRTERPERSPSR